MLSHCLNADNSFLWLSHPSGTFRVQENEVFFKDSPAHTIWTYKLGEKEPILAYSIKFAEAGNGALMCDLYELDYHKHAEFVFKNVIEADTIAIAFEDGQKETLPLCDYKKMPPDRRLAIVRKQYHPKNLHTLQSIQTAHEKWFIAPCTNGSFDRHISSLRKDKRSREAVRVISEIISQQAPGLDGNYSVDLKPRIIREDDVKNIISIIPVKTELINTGGDLWKYKLSMDKESKAELCKIISPYGRSADDISSALSHLRGTRETLQKKKKGRRTAHPRKGGKCLDGR